MAKKKNPAKRKRAATGSAKRKAAARKAARTRAAKANKRSLAAKKAARTRKRNASKRSTARKNPTKRRVRRVRRRKVKRNAATAAPRRRRRRSVAKRRTAPKRRRRMRKNPRRTTAKSASRARRTILNAKKGPHRRTGPGQALIQRFKMRSNPSSIKDAVMKAIPIGVGFLGSKFIVGLGARHIPGMDKLQVGSYDLAPCVLHAGAIMAVHYGTKKGPAIVKRNRDALMLGAGLGLLDCIVRTFAPDSVKSMIGVAPAAAITAAAPTEGYVTVDDYFTVDGYVTVDDFESEMGAVEADLGLEAEMGMVEADLGSFADRHLGGVHRGSMLRPVGTMPMLAPVPSKSFTGVVPPVSASFDSHAGLYQGIFSGGYQ